MHGAYNLSEGEIRTQLCSKIRAVSDKIDENPPTHIPNIAAAYVQFIFGEDLPHYELVPLLFLSGLKTDKAYINIPIPDLNTAANGYKIKFISVYFNTGDSSNLASLTNAFKKELFEERGIIGNLNDFS